MPQTIEAESPQLTGEQNRRSRWWVYALVALLLLIGALVNVVPVAIERGQRFVGSVGEMVRVVAEAGGRVAEQAYGVAREDIERSPEVAEALGEPLEFAAPEDVEWLPSEADSLVFRFRVTGSRAEALAQARVRPTEQGGELQSLYVEQEGERILDLRQTQPQQ